MAKVLFWLFQDGALVPDPKSREVCICFWIPGSRLQRALE